MQQTSCNSLKRRYVEMTYHFGGVFGADVRWCFPVADRLKGSHVYIKLLEITKSNHIFIFLQREDLVSVINTRNVLMV